MTDYLEEHLGNAATLLEWIRQLEQSASGLSGSSILRENVDKLLDFDEKNRNTGEKGEIVPKSKNEVYNTGPEVDQIKKVVDDLDIDLEIREQEQDIAVNRQARADDNGKSLGQVKTASKAEETGARTNAERAENSSPLSAQLEELDRAVSALTTPVPEGRGSARDIYPISLSSPQRPMAGLAMTDVPVEAWDGSGAAVRADPAYGGAQNWVEQADRVFRRDSRRYDGGFYLY